MSIIGSHGMLHSVDNGVAGNVYLALILALSDEVFRCKRRRREVILRHNADRLTVEFLRIRRIQVVRAQSGLDVSHRDLQIEAGKSRHKCGAGIAVDKHHIRLFGFQHRLDSV